MRHRIGSASVIAALALISFGSVAPEPSAGPVIINEVAWAGAEWAATAEWIELFNTSSEAIDLEGWRLVSSDGAPDIGLRGVIPPHISGDPTTGFFLLERDGDGSVPGIAADLVYQGTLNDRGETLYLLDPDGNIADTANAPSDPASEPAPWPAGIDAHGVPSYASMERLDGRLPDTPGNWSSWVSELPLKPTGQPIRGTPRQENSCFNIPPTPAFGLRPRYPAPGTPVEFDASESFDPNDRIASFQWDFGDGTGASGQTANHAYVLSGVYRVALTVTDERGGESKLSQSILVQPASPPLADFSVVTLPPHRIPRAGSPVRFQDESSDSDSDRQIVSWSWWFGDGATASEAAVLHTYDRPGAYDVHLQIYDNQGQEALQTQSITIASRLPVALFARIPELPNVDDPVRFDASASYDPDGQIETYRWDLDGNGTYEVEASDPILEHAFSVGGDYDVGLSVVDSWGDRSATFVETVHVNRPPLAVFQLSAFESEELAPVYFVDLSYDEDGAITCRLWDFGDGTTAEGANPEHAFEDDGMFAVSLTVTDDNGAQRTTISEVVIANLLPIVQLSTEKTTLPTGEAFRLDASGSTDPSPGGSITRYEWDLEGDGAFDETTTSPTLWRVYDDDGTHEILVRVIDDDGGAVVSDPLSITVTNRPPRIHRITWTPEAPTDDVEVRFTATASDPDGEITQWCWDLGNGTVVTGSSPAAEFPDDGRYTVLLTVQDNDGARSDPFSVEVIVENAPPVAEFAVATLAGRCIVFDAHGSRDLSPTGKLVHIAWDFGDGTSCPGGPNGCGGGDRWAPGHCYAEPGTYDVTLVVIDEQGALARSVKSILIPE